MGSTIFAPWCITFFITEPLAGLLVSFRGARANERLAIVESTGVEKGSLMGGAQTVKGWSFRSFSASITFFPPVPINTGLTFLKRVWRDVV